MTDQSPSRPMVQDQRSQGTHPGYMPGFGNDFETEALPGALPQGMNSPQKCNYGLYGEQLSGTAFTAQPSERSAPGATASAPRSNTRTATRRSICPIGSSAPHGPGCDLARPVPLGSGAAFGGTAHMAHRHAHDDHGGRCEHAGGHGEPYLPRHRNRWRTPISSPPTANFWSCRRRAAALLHRAWHHRRRAQGDRDPATRAFLPRRGARRPLPRLCLRELRPKVRAAGAWADWRQLHGQPRDFKTPVAAFEDREVPSTVTVKWCGQFHHRDRPKPARRRGLARQLRTGEIRSAHLLPVGAILFDHPDPSIFTVLTAPSGQPGTANIDFVLFRERWMVMEDTFRPPWYHKNIMSELMGNIYGQYDAKPQGFVPGGVSLAQHDAAARARPRRLRGRIERKSWARQARQHHVLHVRDPLPAAPHRFAAKDAPLQDDYIDCWTDLEKKFDGTPGKK
jgi:homogentisate 1,2-dioxygenase